MKATIKNEEDVKLLVDSFYDKVLKDPTIGFIFTEVNPIVMENHMPVMYLFWNSILLGNPGYVGNIMEKHIDLNEKFKLTKAHFDQWLKLWINTVNENFEGTKADEAISRATSIAAVLQFQLKVAEN
jgi:hemoglobin